LSKVLNTGHCQLLLLLLLLLLLHHVAGSVS
jgi:hypothetical protein